MNQIVKPARAHLWKPGQSGNPAGRPKGSKNNITLLRQALEGELRVQIGPHMAEVLLVAINMAKDGNESMIKLLVDKCLPTSKGDDNTGEESPKVQIMIGKMPERKEDISVNGESVK